MSMTGKATEKQKEALRNFGIEPPPTKSACHHLLSFILEIKFENMNSFQKADFIKKKQWEWIGTKVMIRLGSSDFSNAKPGKVTYITVNPNLYNLLKNHDYFSLFRFHIVSQDGTIKRLVAPSLIQKMETEEKPVS